MKKHRLMGLVLSAALFSIFLLMALMLLWSVAGRWPWPGLLPETYSLRTIKELLTGSASLPRLLSSSILLALTVAVLGTAVGVMTARATENYGFPGRSLVRFGSLLPLLVPGTVFAMGIQITLIRLGLSDTVAGVVLVHLVAAVPYCITIMTDVTRAVGTGLEEQAMVLGAGPVKAFFLTTFPSLLPGILSSMSMGLQPVFYDSDGGRGPGKDHRPGAGPLHPERRPLPVLGVLHCLCGLGAPGLFYF